MVNITEAIYCLVFRVIAGIVLLYGLNLKSERIMQDFTKQNAILSNLNTKQPKWLNKDRLWNFVFWFGMSFGMALGNVIKFRLGLEDLSSTVDLATLFIMPIALLVFNRTRFIKKDTFANSEGVLISKKQMPYSFPLATISGLPIAFVVGTTILSKDVSSFFGAFIFFLSLSSGISLYFILKNCPISILFNRKFWTFEFKAGGVVNNKGHHDSSSRDYYNRIHSPSYRHLPQNIFHR